MKCPTCGHERRPPGITAGDVQLMRDFLAAECERDPGASVGATELRAWYANWRERTGPASPPIASPKRFAAMLRACGVGSWRTAHGTRYVGLRRAAPAQAPAPEL